MKFDTSFLKDLNEQQRTAVTYGIRRFKKRPDGTRKIRLSKPVLFIAGAGTGKTLTLVCRAAYMIARGVDPSRILMLTFTNQAAGEMTSRVKATLSAAAKTSGSQIPSIAWAGTFHSVGLRLIRMYAQRAGLPVNLNVHNRQQSADLMDVARHDTGLAGKGLDFPKKGTCLDIYSKQVNTMLPLRLTLKRYYPDLRKQHKNLAKLFHRYTKLKQENHVVDFDDLLLFWNIMLGNETLAREIGGMFDAVFVDEFQDTNALQASILRSMKPDGRGVTVVGDDAQAIYGFRGSDVRLIRKFPKWFKPRAKMIELNRNYRSTRPITKAANEVINAGGVGFRKTLVAVVKGGDKPRLVSVNDVNAEAKYVAAAIARNVKSDWSLDKQAVLFRSSSHSKALELQLAARGIPFRKVGGQSLLDSAHVHDVMGVLAWAENPKDQLAALRTLKLVRGIGHKTAANIVKRIQASDAPIDELGKVKSPTKARAGWARFVKIMRNLHRGKYSWPAEVDAVLKWYRPHLERKYEDHHQRAADLEQLAHVAGESKSRQVFLQTFALDAPEKLGVAGRSSKGSDEELLTLSTIHACKGREWRSVFVLQVVEGSIPSKRAEKHQEIDEERRLLYVAMTRAKRELTLMVPWRGNERGYQKHRGKVTTTRSRFLPDRVLELFDQQNGDRTGARVNVSKGHQVMKLFDIIEQTYRQ